MSETASEHHDTAAAADRLEPPPRAAADIPTDELAARVRLSASVLGVVLPPELSAKIPANLAEMEPEARVALVELVEAGAESYAGMHDPGEKSPLQAFMPIFLEKVIPLLEQQEQKRAQPKESPMELILELSLQEAAKDLPEGEQPAVACIITLEGNQQIEGAVKRGPLPRYYVVGSQIQRIDQRTRTPMVVDGQILETVFHGSQIMLLSQLRKVDPKLVVEVPKIVLPG